ncbi:NAD(P)-binding protein [Ephemerocybe angulata]|uniref:NAD(P)-binding protein n=1 Tax=Ephemerocybe angulata TaxID=980116 RepID=A0A8H6HWM9_9AGAR|nr:NAD(P)-binding protein [Tulosesus angulatus]
MPDREMAPKPTVHKSFDVEKDLVDMKGKVVIVTGGNTGIGFETVKQLLRAKTSRVYLAARNEGRATEAIDALKAEGLVIAGESEVRWHKLDLGDPKGAKASAEDFLKKEERLDVLINNAADMYSSDIGQYGVSNMHIVNYISPYIFTKTLLPLLKKTALEPDSDVRIVNVTSQMYARVPTPVSYKTLEDFNIKYSWRPASNLVRYANSKLAMNLWSRHLQTQLIASESSGNGVTVLALHPGVVTSYEMPLPCLQGPINNLMRALLKAVEPEVGCRTSVFAAAAKQVRDERERYQAVGGVYLEDLPVPGTVVEMTATAKDDQLKEDLIATTEQFLKELGL